VFGHEDRRGGNFPGDDTEIIIGFSGWAKAVRGGVVQKSSAGSAAAEKRASIADPFGLR